MLKLQENKYYVVKQIIHHLECVVWDGSHGPIYKPLKLVELIPNCDNYMKINNTKICG